jgi:hypothetical protein
MLRVAAIRAWSRRTVHQTFFQSMECQSGIRSGAAPACISAADISACLPESVGQGSLVMEHLREVSPLSRRGDVVRGRTHPLSDRLPNGIGFLPHPLPAAPSATPCGGPTPEGGRRAYHVPRMNHGWFRLCLSAGGLDDDDRGWEIPLYLATYLLVQACQRLWLVGSHDVYQQFT